MDMPKEKKPAAARVCSKTTMIVTGLTLTVVIVAAITCIVEEVAPARTLLTATTPVPIEHHYFTLPYHEQKHRMSYVNNTFGQMLHHTHNATNVTNCWLCGMMPAHQKKGGTPFILLPFSHYGSCRAWLALLRASEVAKITYADVGGLNTQLNRACYPDEEGDPLANGTAWEMEEYRRGNSSARYVFPNTRTTKENGPPVIAVTGDRADLCVSSIGSIPVGKIDFTLALNTTVMNDSSFLSSHNTYFICGSKGYYHLPIGRLGSCYVSFLLPPVFLAPASYHKDYKLYNDISKRRFKRTLNNDEVHQTDTALQQYIDFNSGLFFFVAADLNSRKIRCLTRVVESVTNQTAMAHGNITEELQIARIVTLQNRMVLDVILADRGRTCRFPDHAPSVFDAIFKMHKIASEIRQDSGTWTLTGWLWNMFTEWGWKLLSALCIFVAILFTCCLCFQ
ncbi:syncytin-2-like [Lissotriton helveticus]